MKTQDLSCHAGVYTHNSTYYDAERFEIWNTGTRALNLIFAEKKKIRGVRTLEDIQTSPLS